jgi:hypothetical protein
VLGSDLPSVVWTARVTAEAAATAAAAPRLADHRTAGRRPTALGVRRIGATARARPATAQPAARARAAGLALMVKVSEYLIGDDATGFVTFPAARQAAEPPGSFGLVRTVNLVPRHTVIWRPDTPLLWDVWERVLGDAVVVDPQPSLEEQARLTAAQNLLFADPTTATPSPAYGRYRELVEAYLDAVEAAADAMATGGTPDGLAAAVEVAADRLAVEGRRTAIEAALDTIATFGMSRPSTSWNEARGALQLLTNRKVDPDSNTEYPDTSFVPRSFDEAVWTPIDLVATEIAALSTVAEDRFPELSTSHLFDDTVADENGALRVTRVRAEASIFSVVRPWFLPYVLLGRAWRWRDAASEPVSDGGNPATGRLPAFVAGIAVVRNVTVDRIGVTTRDNRAASPIHRHQATTPAASVMARIRETTSSIDRIRGATRHARAASGQAHTSTQGHAATVLPHHQPQPYIAALACESVPRSPDPDPRLFPDLRNGDLQ